MAPPSRLPLVSTWTVTSGVGARVNMWTQQKLRCAVSCHTAPRSKKAKGPDADIAKWEVDRKLCPCGSGAHYEVSTLTVYL